MRAHAPHGAVYESAAEPFCSRSFKAIVPHKAHPYDPEKAAQSQQAPPHGHYFPDGECVAYISVAEGIADDSANIVLAR